jgi:glycosyltransferase involved in cell wall biosynthesis
MRSDLSVVIICKNAAGHIGRTLQSALPLCSDIVVYDSGSTDDTLRIAKELGARVEQGAWAGFGNTRNAAAATAKNEWVFALDADEALEEPLLRALQQVSLTEENIAYKVHLANYLGNTLIRHGAWGGDHRIRLYNRQRVQWNDDAVHEKLVLPEGTQVQLLEGSIRHRTAESLEDYKGKLERYAAATGEKYFRQGIRAGLIKRWLSPAYTFFKNYFLKLGFLDGRYGWALAAATAVYTFRKYRRLHELELERS